VYRQRYTPLEIKLQGKPVLTAPRAWVVRQGRGIAVLEIDLKSKYCDAGASISSSDGGCGVLIDATEHSIYLDDSKDADFTEVWFTEFNGWDVWGNEVESDIDLLSESATGRCDKGLSGYCI